MTPGDAAVRVAGAEAEVDGGQFFAEVKLQPGGNVIDVTATAPGRRAATDAVRVLRDMRVEVPAARRRRGRCRRRRRSAGAICAPSRSAAGAGSTA